MAEKPEIEMSFHTVFNAEQIKRRLGFGYR